VSGTIRLIHCDDCSWQVCDDGAYHCDEVDEGCKGFVPQGCLKVIDLGFEEGTACTDVV